MWFKLREKFKSFMSVKQSQSRQKTRLFLQSSELDPLPPPPPNLQGSVSPDPFVPGRGGNTLVCAGEGVGGPNSDEGRDTVVL
jgi:hypothetical protein